MIWHPLLMAILSVDAITGLLTLAVAGSAFRIALSWNRASADRSQISLEGHAELASIRGRWVVILLLFSGFLLVLGISNLFHRVIPGAMCGTGVLQALGRGGQSMLAFRALWIIAMYFWYELDQLNRTDTGHPLTVHNARLLLAATPLGVLTLAETIKVFSTVNTHQPVDCCAVVYNQFRSLKDARSIAGLPDTYWLVGLLVLSILLVGLTVGLRVSGAKSNRLRSALAITSILWVPTAAASLVNILSAYHYGVLHHHCPWCLFLPRYYFVGYPLFGTLAVVAVEGVLILFLPLWVRGVEQLVAPARQRCCRACNRMLTAYVVFMLLACLPPLIWRLRHGVWLGG